MLEHKDKKEEQQLIESTAVVWTSHSVLRAIMGEAPPTILFSVKLKIKSFNNSVIEWLKGNRGFI